MIFHLCLLDKLVGVSSEYCVSFILHLSIDVKIEKLKYLMCEHLTFNCPNLHHRRGERRFQSKVKNIINVIKFSSFSSTFTGNKVGPAERHFSS